MSNPARRSLTVAALIGPRGMRKGLGLLSVDFLGVHTEFGEGGDGLLGVKFAIAGEPRERGGDDGFGIDFEMAAEVLAIVAASEAIGAERFEAAGQPWGDLVGDRLHVIAGGDDG